MKKLLVLLVLLPMLCSAQIKDTIPKHNRTPGDELRLATKRFYLGTLLSLGGGIAIVGSQRGTDTSAKVYGALGGVLIIAGLVLTVNSWEHINKAGILMNERKIGLTFNEGIGIRYRI